MQALGQLAGGIAHDFNNVLQAVAGAAALIERDPADEAGVRRLARLAIEAAERGASASPAACWPSAAAATCAPKALDAGRPA